MTQSSTGQRRLPAEWEMNGAVLMAWPHALTDWAYMLEEVRDCFREIVKAIIPRSKVVVIAPDISEPAACFKDIPSEKIFYFRAPTNDTRTRDYGPLSVIGHSGRYLPVDFRFNGWGQKFASNLDNIVVRSMSDTHLISQRLENRQDFVLEGGGIESNGEGIIMTTATCQLSPNRNPTLSREEIEHYLLAVFGAKKCIWLEHGYLAGDDTDSHIDTLARFAPGNTIIFTGCDDPEDEHFEELNLMENELKQARTIAGNPFNLIRLPLPDAIYDEEGNRLPATYANFLALPGAVIMPTYGQPKKDSMALQMLRIAFDVPVVAVDCKALIKQHGSLHCMTMQMPWQILSI